MPEITVEAHGWRYTALKDGSVVVDNKPTVDEARRNGRPTPELQRCVVPMPLIVEIAAQHLSE